MAVFREVRRFLRRTRLSSDPRQLVISFRDSFPVIAQQSVNRTQKQCLGFQHVHEFFTAFFTAFSFAQLHLHVS